MCMPPVRRPLSGVGCFSERAGQFIMALDDDNRIVCYAHLAEGSTEQHPCRGSYPARPADSVHGQYRPGRCKRRPLLMPHLHFGVRVLGDAGRSQSVLAQAQRAAVVSPFIESLTADPIEDPALNYTMYDVVHPSFEGTTYRRIGTVPAPTAGHRLVARDVTAAPQATASVAVAPVVEDIPELPPGVGGGEHIPRLDSVQSPGGSVHRIETPVPPR